MRAETGDEPREPTKSGRLRCRRGWCRGWRKDPRAVGEQIVSGEGEAAGRCRRWQSARPAAGVDSEAGWAVGSAAVGQPVRKGQVLLRLYLPVLEKQLQQQRGNLEQLQRINRDLDLRDALRLRTEALAVQTALAKLDDDAKRYRQLQRTYSSKLRSLEWLSRRQVVAPLSTEVVSAEQGLTNTSVNLDDVKINEKKVLTSYQQVKLQIETQALQRRYQIDDLKRALKVAAKAGGAA